MTAPRPHSELAARQSLTDELRLAARDAALADINGWGNLFSDAADTIDNLRAQLAEAQAALKTVMRNAELSKEPCGPDPESPAAIRNGKFAGLASIAAQGLGMVRGPSLTEHLVEAQVDAERYSWLRMNRLWLKANLPAIAAPDFDAAIDAAIDAAKGGSNA